MGQYYLAVDIGASSGRHILAHKEGQKIILEEIYRFSNGMVRKKGSLIWEVDRLFEEIKNGMKKCWELGKIPVSVGIDTWAVDFVLLDQEGNRIGDAVAYRDKRTEEMDRQVYEIIGEQELYQRTGIQKQSFNTIYQLMALKMQKPKELAKAEKLLMIPDYFHYLLTGKTATEYTNATTTQLVNATTKDWDWELIRRLGYPEKVLERIVLPGTILGELSKELSGEIGYNCSVVLPATHDTGSAVMAVPAAAKEAERSLYISSGTWSLMGTELLTADCSVESMQHNLTNEGGYDYRFRYLKNIMGLWMIQSVKKEIARELGFDEICRLAAESRISSRVDCNDNRFLSPDSMTLEIQKACKETGQPVPETVAEVAAVIYNSLADCYAETVKEIEALTGKEYERIHIVGGGANAEYLNQLTAEATGKTVYAGPTEATAIGNLAAQMIAGGELKDLSDARECIRNSFSLKSYEAY